MLFWPITKTLCVIVRSTKDLLSFQGPRSANFGSKIGMVSILKMKSIIFMFSSILRAHRLWNCQFLHILDVIVRFRSKYYTPGISLNIPKIAFSETMRPQYWTKHENDAKRFWPKKVLGVDNFSQNFKLVRNQLIFAEIHIFFKSLFTDFFSSKYGCIKLIRLLKQCFASGVWQKV